MSTAPISNRSLVGRKSGPGSKHHSRRGSMTLNFSNMSFSPLTSSDGVLGIDENSFQRNREKKPVKLRNGSYIQAVSAPTTPGILAITPSASYFAHQNPHFDVQQPSRSTSTSRAASRRNSNSNTTNTTPRPLYGYFPANVSHHQPPLGRKSKSATQLLPPHYHASTSTSPGFPFSTPSSYHSSMTNMHTPQNPPRDTTWLHRTGALLTTSSQEYKGQSWLASRASSTSLVDLEMDSGGLDGARYGIRYYSDNAPPTRENFYHHHNHHGHEECEGEVFYDPEGAEPGRRTPGYANSAVLGDDYLDGEYHQYELNPDSYYYTYDDLHTATALGLGTWVDRILGWSLFSFEDSDDEGAAEREREREKERQRELEREKALRGSSPVSKPPWQQRRWRNRRNAGTAEGAVGTVDDGEEGGEEFAENSWGDPSWIFQIATKVLF